MKTYKLSYLLALLSDKLIWQLWKRITTPSQVNAQSDHYLGRRKQNVSMATSMSSFVRSLQVMIYTERLMTSSVVSVIGYVQGMKLFMQTMSWIRMWNLYCQVQWFSNFFVHGTLWCKKYCRGKKDENKKPQYTEGGVLLWFGQDGALFF
jgi:hypothetical protein